MPPEDFEATDYGGIIDESGSVKELKNELTDEMKQYIKIRADERYAMQEALDLGIMHGAKTVHEMIRGARERYTKGGDFDEPENLFMTLKTRIESTLQQLQLAYNTSKITVNGVPQKPVTNVILEHLQTYNKLLNVVLRSYNMEYYIKFDYNMNTEQIIFAPKNLTGHIILNIIELTDESH